MIDLLFFPTKWHAFENNPVIPENATLGEAVFLHHRLFKNEKVPFTDDLLFQQHIGYSHSCNVSRQRVVTDDLEKVKAWCGKGIEKYFDD